jgi:hypothetical protein
MSQNTPRPNEPPRIPARPGTNTDPDDPRVVENPGDPGPPVVIPPKVDDPRKDPRIPDEEVPQPGV